MDGEAASLLAEIETLRRTRDGLVAEIAAAEARHAQVAERTMEARERRQSLAGEVIALCGERAALIERISTLRIAAIELEASTMAAIPLPPRHMVAPAAPEAMADSVPASEPDPVPEPVPAPPPMVPAEPVRCAPPVDDGGVARAMLAAPSGKVVASWLARARTTVKPRNDSYETGARTLWRRSEDRLRLSSSGGGVLAAVSDGAGASGLFCGAWAEELVGRLPAAPLSSIDDLNRWLDGFCLKFRQTTLAQCKSDPPKHSKFVREGSFATLSACWLSADDSGVTAHWLGYGDSPLLVFDRTGNEPELVLAHPVSLAAFDRDPHLLNWMAVPEAQRLSAGKLLLPARATVVLASDGIGQYVMLRHLAAAGRAGSAPGAALAKEFAGLAQRGEGRLATAAKAHAARPAASAAEAHAALWASLSDDAGFTALVASRCDEGLLANDDSTVIMIETERGCA